MILCPLIPLSPSLVSLFLRSTLLLFSVPLRSFLSVSCFPVLLSLFSVVRISPSFFSATSLSSLGTLLLIVCLVTFLVVTPTLTASIMVRMVLRLVCCFSSGKAWFGLILCLFLAPASLIFNGYPREYYRLVKSNFRSKFPPHDAFAGWCRSVFTVGLAGSVLEDVTDRFRVVPHWDGSGDFVADFVYRTRLPDRDGSLLHWFEVHTGSEGYDENVFLKRLLTMEQFLADQANSFFVVLVPFVSDVVKGEEAIRKYNLSVTSTDKPVLTLQKSRLLHYKQISSLRGEVGSFEHRTR